MVSETELKGVVVIKVGPIKARFAGDVTLSDLDPPNGYVLSGKAAPRAWQRGLLA
jgi:carbon monoxide dehydrogenase subunit G